MRFPAIPGIFVSSAAKVPVVAHGLGVRELRLNRVENRPAPDRVRRKPRLKENRFVAALCSVLDALSTWLGDVLSLAASFNPMRLAES